MLSLTEKKNNYKKISVHYSKKLKITRVYSKNWSVKLNKSKLH